MLSSATLGRPATSRRQTSRKQEGLLGSIGRFYVIGSVYALGAEGSGRAGTLSRCRARARLYARLLATRPW